ANEAFLADCEFITQTDGRNAGNGDGTDWNISSARDDLQAATDVHAVPTRFVDAEQDLLGVCLNRSGLSWCYAVGCAACVNAGPIEYADVVQIAFGLEQFALA